MVSNTDKAAKKAAPKKTAKAAKAAPVKAAPTPAKKAAPRKAAAKKTEPATHGSAAVEDWDAGELAALRGELQASLTDLHEEYTRALADLDTLQQQASDGAGDDQADAGTKTSEREQEMSIARNKHELITQTEHAIERIDAGTYGRCESCGQLITKARLQAFPAATLCVTCKQREERH